MQELSQRNMIEVILIAVLLITTLSYTNGVRENSSFFVSRDKSIFKIPNSSIKESDYATVFFCKKIAVR